MKHLQAGLPHPTCNGLRLSYLLRVITGDRRGRLFQGECSCTSVAERERERERSILFNERVIPNLTQRQ